MRRRILVVQPSFQPPGGGNGLAAWVLQALQDHHDVGVLTWTPLDLDEVNHFYGTSVRRQSIHAARAYRGLRPLLEHTPLSLALLKKAFLLRAARRVSTEWDTLMTLDNEADLGRPGIQYVNYPAYRRPRPKDDVRWYHGPPFILDAYYALADWIADISIERVRQNLTLVNSNWTGGVVRESHGVRSHTLYPPVHAHFVDMPWQDRMEAFLCVGRISPEKEIHRVIDILSRVRKRHPEISLRLVGTLSNDRYCASVTARIKAEGDWITIDDNLARRELLDLIPRFRYGIHGMLEEHFGMAPAEMASAGCVVFVPRGGGQVEIVDHEPRLTYTTVEEAADNICYVLEHPDEQTRLRTRLAERRDLYSTERFMRTIRDIVDAFPAP